YAALRPQSAPREDPHAHPQSAGPSRDLRAGLSGERGIEHMAGMAEGQATETAEPLFAPSDPLAARAVSLLREQFAGDMLDVGEYRGQTSVAVRPQTIEAICRALRDAPELRFGFLSQITAVDWP